MHGRNHLFVSRPSGPCRSAANIYRPYPMTTCFASVDCMTRTSLACLVTNRRSFSHSLADDVTASESTAISIASDSRSRLRAADAWDAVVRLAWRHRWDFGEERHESTPDYPVDVAPA